MIYPSIVLRKVVRENIFKKLGGIFCRGFRVRSAACCLYLIGIERTSPLNTLSVTIWHTNAINKGMGGENSTRRKTVYLIWNFYQQILPLISEDLYIFEIPTYTAYNIWQKIWHSSNKKNFSCPAFLDLLFRTTKVRQNCPVNDSKS